LGFTLAAMLVLALWAFPLPAVADTARVHFGGWSHHVMADGQFNEDHRMAAGQYGPYVAGRFVNSYNRESWFGAYEWTWHPWPEVETFLWSGVVRGYTDCTFNDAGRGQSQVCPFGVAGVRWTRYKLEPQALVVGNALVAAASWRF